MWIIYGEKCQKFLVLYSLNIYIDLKELYENPRLLQSASCNKDLAYNNLHLEALERLDPFPLCVRGSETPFYWGGYSVLEILMGEHGSCMAGGYLHTF